MAKHPIRSLHHIRAELEEITSSMRRALRKRNFDQMTVSIDALTALGPRIDVVTAEIQSTISADVQAAVAAQKAADDAANASAIADAVAAEAAANQSTIDGAASDLGTRVTALEAAAASAAPPPTPTPTA